MTDEGDSVSVKEAARLVLRSEETVRRWVWSGELRSVRRGRRHLVSRSDLAIVAAAKGSPSLVSLAGWAEEARAALSVSGTKGSPSAKDLVLADRAGRR